MENVKTFAEVMDILKENEKEIKKRYGIKNIGIFGSYLKGNATSASDLDILVEFEPDVEMGLLKFVDIENDLSDIFGIKVDLVEKPVLKPKIGKHILKEVVYP